MEKIADLPLFGIFITLVVFFISLRLHERYKRVLFNPVLLSSTFIIIFLSLFEINYVKYNIGGQYLSFFLGPSVVALGILFYEKYLLIKENMFSFLVSVTAGSLMSILSVVILCILYSFPEEITRSLFLKSITTPIAVEVSKAINGIPALTAGVVILVGIIGNAFGPELLKFLRIKGFAEIGTSLGTSAHGIGTARAIEINELSGAYSGLAMCVNGILTALIAPYVVNWFQLY